jgi:ligand-binding sensor domain-containing protein
VWVIENNKKGAVWLASKNGITKTKTEAQAIVNAEVTAKQTAWDALDDDEKLALSRPENITLP